MSKEFELWENEDLRRSKFAYVANDGRGSVQKIDLVSNHIVKTIRSLPTREATAWPSGQEAS